ncbi:hypothetical protein [Liquorilactobacillus satsumensis]|uniref:hypothetical protein n=1 Tax=Liquorilactobacillus satsumensis TaxID=259059 RepID=UPI001E35723A|nr:hypothetical protein [Liquorilactobacillus satsumensis]MCC7665651.1 hypothetical protein [Liquorilactobacillus satsumensis]MCP9311863.1 hypothetical protein [Liquorilactobacillus satsumensis]MCP9328337.1 hypothetical protein [Liquorilactobacillus satsumensis]MCP9358036.1 hypothetical protein [Liquorilactobacillus satsumensis]MCP9358996.1 hypothetical protein [Liquorilactobacillus satsumensis]
MYLSDLCTLTADLNKELRLFFEIEKNTKTPITNFNMVPATGLVFSTALGKQKALKLGEVPVLFHDSAAPVTVFIQYAGHNYPVLGYRIIANGLVFNGLALQSS